MCGYVAVRAANILFLALEREAFGLVVVMEGVSYNNHYD